MLPFLKSLKLIYSLPITYFIITDHAVFEYLLNKLKRNSKNIKIIEQLLTFFKKLIYLFKNN